MFNQTLDSFMIAVPELIGVLVILVLGYMAGKIAGSMVRRIIDRSQIDRMVMRTPLGRAMGETERGVSRTFGSLVKWFVYTVAVLAAASLLEITILSSWISTVITYVPAFVAGLLIIVLGFIVADFIGDVVAGTKMMNRTEHTRIISEGVKVFLYFVALVIGLDTIGIDVTLLYILGRAVSWGLALGLALAIGIGLGWGSKDYVSENIEDWMARFRDETPD